jgi:hypothetical protein
VGQKHPSVGVLPVECQPRDPALRGLGRRQPLRQKRGLAEPGRCCDQDQPRPFASVCAESIGEAGTRNTALFIQDTWRALPNLTLNFGLRSERERVPNFGTTGVEYPIEFGWGEKLAPRLGFTYDPFNDGRTKLYGSWCKYYDVMKYELPRGSFGGDRWVDYYFTWNNPDVNVNTAAGCATGTNTFSERPTCTLVAAIAVERSFASS